MPIRIDSSTLVELSALSCQENSPDLLKGIAVTGLLALLVAVLAKGCGRILALKLDTTFPQGSSQLVSGAAGEPNRNRKRVRCPINAWSSTG